jgi:phosphoserine phosphatase
MTRLHLFDMDGTLLRGSSANVELARVMGVVDEFRALDARFATGALNPPEYARQAYGMWSSLLPEQVAAAFDAAPWLRGIREVWADIRARGEYCAVISLSPDFFVRRLLEWGVQEAYGSRFPPPPFRGVPLDVTGLLAPESKVAIADELCARYGVRRERCVAYGDSMSDAPLFAVVPLSVAVNGDHHVAGIATRAYHGDDLRDAYALAVDAG